MSKLNFRQGDVLILASNIGKKHGYKEKSNNIIIEGEIAGHYHGIEKGKLYEKEDLLIVEADTGCILTHPEHANIPLPKGRYEIKIQVEYDDTNPTMKSKVKD